MSLSRRLMSVFCSLILAFTMIPAAAVSAFATDDNVAKIGDAEYAALGEAIAAAEEGDTITLIGNADIYSTIAIEKSLTIDLNGNLITGQGVRVFQVKSGDFNLVSTDAPGVVSVVNTASTTISPDSSVIRVGDNSGTARNVSLTVGENVTVSTGCCYCISVFGSATTETLTINGTVCQTGADDLARPAVSGNGSTGYGNTTIIVNGTVQSNNENAIYHPPRLVP